jgi:hypothetical protein
MAAVNLHHVHAGFHGSFSGIGKETDPVVNIFLTHHVDG